MNNGMIPLIVVCIAIVVGIGMVQFRQSIYNQYKYDFLGLLNNLLAFGGMSALFILVGMLVQGGDWSDYTAFVIGGLVCGAILFYRHIKAMGAVKGSLFALIQIIGTFGIIIMKIFEFGFIILGAMNGGSNKKGVRFIKPLDKGMSEREYYERQGADDEVEAILMGGDSYEGTLEQQQYNQAQKQQKEEFYN